MFTKRGIETKELGAIEKDPEKLKKLLADRNYIVTIEYDIDQALKVLAPQVAPNSPLMISYDYSSGKPVLRLENPMEVMEELCVNPALDIIWTPDEGVENIAHPGLVM